MSTTTRSLWVRIHRTGTAQEFVCRRDQVAETLADAGWFDVDETVSSALAALQRVLTGAERRSSAGLETFLGVTVVPAVGFIAAHADTNGDAPHGTADVGPAVAPPSWCESGAEPDSYIERDGSAVSTWDRSFGSGDVWLTCTDRTVEGRVRRSAALIGCESAYKGMTASQARILAAELLNAADVLDTAIARAVSAK